ncbi:MAG: DUF362 domain-containing protein, partial [Nitrospinota bacterium]
EDAVTTHPSLVSAVARHVIEAGGEPFIGDSPPLGSFKKIVTKTGMQKIADEQDLEITEFLKSSGLPRMPHHIFKRLEIAKEAQDADVIINLPKLKTHSLTRLTLSVKNIFGCVVGKRKAQWHLNAGTDDMFFARMLVELYEEIKPDLTILDGIVSMEGNGPAGGTPRPTDVIVSGTDCVAIDTVVCNVLGKKWDYLFTNRAAKEKEIGETDLRKIEVSGDSLERVQVSGFVFPKSFELGRVGAFLKKHVQSGFTQKPVEDVLKCTLCGSCISICPASVIKKKERRLHFDYPGCIRCFCCHEVCPENAMMIKNGTGLTLLSRFSTSPKTGNIKHR